MPNVVLSLAFFRILRLQCPTFKVSILEETRRFGNVLLKLNVTSSKYENGDDATVSVDIVSLEGSR